jgi:hypothetical protein
MFNLSIYSKPYINSNGKKIFPCLKVGAANRFKYYTPYPYFASHISNKPIKRVENDFRESTANELLARARRVITFSDESELEPVKYSRKHFGKLADRVHAAGSCDHLSYWRSFWNTKFILNEPYYIDPDYIMKLRAQGLVAIELPVDISPYCGCWDPNLGAKPWTRSFLICDLGDLDELKSLFAQYCEHIQISSIDEELIEHIELIPAWNSLEGINHA